MLSVAGDVISPRRPGHRDDTVRQIMCLLSCAETGIIPLDSEMFTKLPALAD